MAALIYAWNGSQYVRQEAVLESLNCESYAGCTARFRSVGDFHGETIAIGVPSGESGSIMPVFTGKVVASESKAGMYDGVAVSWFKLWLEGFTRMRHATTMSLSGLVSGLIQGTECYYNGNTEDANGTCPVGVKYNPNADSGGDLDPHNVILEAEDATFKIKDFANALARSGFHIVSAPEQVAIEEASGVINERVMVLGPSQYETYGYNEVVDSNGIRVRLGGETGYNGVLVYGWSSKKHMNETLDVPTQEPYEVTLSYVPVSRLHVYQMAEDSEGNWVPVLELCEDVDFQVKQDSETDPPTLEFLSDKYAGAKVLVVYDGKKYSVARVGQGSPFKLVRSDGGDPETFDDIQNNRASRIYSELSTTKKVVIESQMFGEVNGTLGFFWITAQDWEWRYRTSYTVHTVAPVAGMKIKATKGTTSVVAVVKSWRLDVSRGKIIVEARNPEVVEGIGDALKILGVEVRYAVGYRDLMPPGSDYTPI